MSHDRSEGPGGGPAEVIAAMSKATARQADSRPSSGQRAGAAGDVQELNSDFIQQGLMANFRFLPSLLPFGDLNPVKDGPAPPLHEGLVRRVFVKQVFNGWDRVDASKQPTVYQTQPADSYSKKVITPLPEASGQHYTANIAAADRN